GPLRLYRRDRYVSIVCPHSFCAADVSAIPGGGRRTRKERQQHLTTNLVYQECEMKVIDGLKPELFWKYFAEIARIPRPSKHEERIARYVLDTAKELGLDAIQDGCGNIVVRKPASPGREQGSSICLQAHLDMVCEKNADKVHDFLKDPIELVRKGDTITANGTTLGADNGVGVATSLAIMADRSLVHGPLELLFTVDEETGLTGAQHLDPALVASRTLLNLDSEEEGVLFVGCAGGRDTLGRWQ